MPQLSDGWIEFLQVGTILLVSPLVTGLIARGEAIAQGRRGPRILQPYYDIAKLFRKETVLPEGAGPLFRAAPYVAFACYCVVPLVIPVLTAFPPQGSYLADILGGGLVLGLASWSVSLAAIDSGSPYAQLGSSRVRSFGALGEPVVIFVVFTVALITQTDLPYAFAKTLESSSVEIVLPSHLLAAAAFLMVVLAETGRIPIESHGGTLEFGLIEEGRTLEHSGPGMALLKWGSSMKQLILYVILLDALVVPWGISQSRSLGDVLLAILYLFLKAVGLGVVVVVIESSFAKLRLYKIPEFTVAAFLLALLAVVMFVLQRDYGVAQLTVFGGVASVVAIAVLLQGHRRAAWGGLDHPQPRRRDARAFGPQGADRRAARNRARELLVHRLLAPQDRRRLAAANRSTRCRGRRGRRRLPADDHPALRAVAADRLSRAGERGDARRPGHRPIVAAHPRPLAALRRGDRTTRLRPPRPVLRRAEDSGDDRRAHEVEGLIG